jgi:class 3 adenylate cyclase
MSDRRHADVFEVLSCQLQQNCFVDLTVMFCDLVGSTELSGKLDPEDLREKTVQTRSRVRLKPGTRKGLCLVH